ncbi:MAG: TetR/AcrR family transcriptional regulator [Actinomycetia bacterium]|nr:TetR/AcrR family transcriptional regulator [Actinomycetes bacterium]
MTKQQERTERSTRALLDAAGAIIVEEGFAAMTFAKIGERAGYSRGLVTARFGSKEGLVETLIDLIVNGWSHKNVIPATKGADGIDGVETLIMSIRRQIARDDTGVKVLYALMFESLGHDVALKERFSRLHHTMRRDFAGMVRQGIRDGTIRPDVDPKREAVLIISGLRGIGYQWLLDQGRFDPLPALDYLAQTTVDRLVADKDAQ